MRRRRSRRGRPCRTDRAGVCSGRNAIPATGRTGRRRGSRRTGRDRRWADSSASSNRRPLRAGSDARGPRGRSGTARRLRPPRRTARNSFPHRHRWRRGGMEYPATPGSGPVPVGPAPRPGSGRTASVRGRRWSCRRSEVLPSSRWCRTPVRGAPRGSRDRQWNLNREWSRDHPAVHRGPAVRSYPPSTTSWVDPSRVAADGHLRTRPVGSDVGCPTRRFPRKPATSADRHGTAGPAHGSCASIWRPSSSVRLRT